MKEEISRLVDSDLEAGDVARVLRAMSSDPDLVRTWDRYQAIGAAMRGELRSELHADLPGRVMRQVASEPVQLAPGRLSGRRAERPVRQWVALAAAASVAAVAIVAMGPRDRGAAVQEARLVQPVSVGATRWETLPPEVENRLNAYLVEHGEFASNHGLNGMAPYARFVGYDGQN